VAAVRNTILVPEEIFYSSIIIALLSMFFLIPYSAFAQYNSTLVYLSGAFDSFQMVSFFILLVVIGSWLKASRFDRKERVVMLFLIAFLILLLFCVQQLLVADSISTEFFGRVKIDSREPEPWLTTTVTTYAKAIFGGRVSTGIDNATPSDFVLRQWTITLLSFLFLSQRQLKWRILSKRIIQVILILILLYISFARYVRLQSAPLDMAVSLGLGNIMIWPILFLIAEVGSAPPDSDIYYSFAFSCIILLACFSVVAKNPSWPGIWLLLLPAVPAFVLARYMLRRVLRSGQTSSQKE
jgi:hypothetical protein